ncbi:PIN domain-containing protein [Lysobacter niabensis]|uniref:PIN domain-containing protein n=1 Tax=Agrilutibacter niabensis TaxID=380628 RepID=UPI00360F9B23
MTTPFFLIDFENVQPKALDRLTPGAARIKVFLGQHQSKLMLELVQALQPFGADAEYIQIQGSGPDAVDFHIAFYIGRLSLAHPGATFNIISKDKGFDPLVKHLAALGIGCKRLAEIPGQAAMPAAVAATAPAKTTPRTAATRQPAAKVAKAAKAAKTAVKATVQPPQAGANAKPAAGTSAGARAKVVVARLKKSSKPAKLSTLRSAIKACFTPVLDDAAIDAVIQSLRSSKKIVVAGDKVTYALG